MRQLNDIPRPGRGFTLVELVLVLVITATLTAIAVPRFSTSVNHARLDGATRRLVADLDYARANASMAGESRTVTFDLTAGSYTIDGISNLDRSTAVYSVDTRQDLFGTTLDAAVLGGDNKLVFNGYGVPDSAASITLRLGSQTRTVTVDPGSGKASAP